MAYIVIMVGHMVREQRCQERWSHSGYSTKFETWNGCFVQMGGSWIPEANVKIAR